MNIFEYNDFNELYHELSRLPCLQFEEYKDKLTRTGSTYHMKNVLIHCKSYACDIRMDKLNYTISKWTSLVNKYIDPIDYQSFKERLSKNDKKTATFNFKIHKGEKQGCLIAMVFTRSNNNKPWDCANIYYRTFDTYKAFPCDLILLNRMFTELPNCNIIDIYLHVPNVFWRVQFLSELIGGYFTLEEFNQNNFGCNHVKELYNAYYAPGAKEVKLHSISRKQKLKKRTEALPEIHIDDLKIFETEESLF